MPGSIPFRQRVVAALHAASPDGNLDEADLPASLRGKLTARSPARLKS